MVALAGGTPGKPATAGPPNEAVQALVAAYPQFLASADDTTLFWRDGTRMPIRDNKPAKSPAELLVAPDLLDQFHYSYPLGESASPPAMDQDPGRIRNLPLFDKMYGRCERNGVQPNLVSVPWLPGRGGKPIPFSKVNGAADALAAVAKDLDGLPAAMTRFLVPTAGSYNCRSIAGTNQLSAHGYGIAIDLNVANADYWRWGGVSKYRNRIPAAVVAIFEKHGFVWGGKWFHYDTMHFEYRPELLAVARRQAVR